MIVQEDQSSNVATVYPLTLNVTTQAVHIQKKKDVLFVVRADMKITMKLKELKNT